MEKANIQPLGTLSGPLLVFGGSYSNLQALEALKKAAEAKAIPPENIICTGDVVGYCADPEATVQTVMEWGIRVVAGNVELQLRSGAEDCGCDFNTGGRCDVFSRQWYPFAQKALSETSLTWMKTLPEALQFTYGGQSATVLHGSWFETAGYVFQSTPWSEKLRHFSAAESQLILAGHCGLPFAHQYEHYSWLNAGVIGMPANDGTPRVWYLTLETSATGWQHQFHSLEYDFREAAQRMHQRRLPQAYAKTLVTGLWDNCEILPEEETLLQGQPIVF